MAKREVKRKDGNKVYVGIPFVNPNFVYFELFEGEHPSNKIYSIQREDWWKFVNTVPYPFYEFGAWYVPSGEYQAQKNALSHLRVYPTNILRKFMEERGITLPESVYIQPRAYEIRKMNQQPDPIIAYPPYDELGEDYRDVVYDIANFKFVDDGGNEVSPSPDNNGSSDGGNNKGKILLAALVAAISLFK